MNKGTVSNGTIIKETNLNTLRKLLRTERTATKSRLAELSGLSVVTVQSLVKTLLDSGEIIEDVTVHPQLGRPAASFRYNDRFRLALTVKMYEVRGMDTAEYTVYNLCGEVLDSHREPLPVVTLESCHGAIDSLVTRYPAISVIGFGLPAEEINGRLVVSDYELLLNAELCSSYEQRYHIPVFVENDINAALLGYCVSHGFSAEDDSYIAGLYIPAKYPAGASLCHNLRILKGRSGLAGELKYLPLGIDWSTFTYSANELEDFAFKAVQALISIYNPGRVVIYSEIVTSRVAERLRRTFTSETELLMLPEIEIYGSLKDDFNTGLARMALERLL